MAQKFVRPGYVPALNLRAAQGLQRASQAGAESLVFGEREVAPGGLELGRAQGRCDAQIRDFRRHTMTEQYGSQ
ncbi:MAG TPA: hypothetical protein VGB85_34275 [Nannocystis sp.]